MRYTVVLTDEPEDHAVSVRVPAMPGIFTWGETREEALAMAREAIGLYLEQYAERGEPFPKDRPLARVRRQPLSRKETVALARNQVRLGRELRRSGKLKAYRQGAAPRAPRAKASRVIIDVPTPSEVDSSGRRLAG